MGTTGLSELREHCPPGGQTPLRRDRSLLSPKQPLCFPTYSAGRAVVCYFPEGRRMTAGEGKPGSWAPEASGPRGEGERAGGRGLPRRATDESLWETGSTRTQSGAIGSCYQVSATLLFGWPNPPVIVKVLEVQCH